MNMLETGLKEFTTAEELQNYINENENVMVCCGRMGPMCIPVYDIMEEMQEEDEYKHIKFAVMAFDNQEAHIIRNAPECSGFMGLPFTMYYNKAKTIDATTSIQNRDQITEILNAKFSNVSETIIG